MDVEYADKEPGAQEGEPDPGAAEVGEGGGEDYVVLEPGTRAAVLYEGAKVLCTVKELFGPEDEFYKIRIDGHSDDLLWHYTELFAEDAKLDDMRITVRHHAQHVRFMRAFGKLGKRPGSVPNMLYSPAYRIKCQQEAQAISRELRKQVRFANTNSNKQEHAGMGGSKLADLRARLPSLGQHRAESAVLAEMKACLELAETRAISMEPAALEARRKHFEGLKSNLHVPITGEDQARAGMCDDCGFVAVCRCLLCFVLTRVLCRFGR